MKESSGVGILCFYTVNARLVKTARLWALVFLLLAAPALGAEFTGRVVAIADGDTLTLLDSGKTQHRIRIDGIDAPEKGQAFGQRSKQSLSDLAFSRNALAECHKVDRYRRAVCKVIVEGIDVGLEQIRRGMAWHYKRYQAEQSAEDRRKYSDAEIAARQEKRGLWRDHEPMPPWEWRKTLRR